MQGGYSQLVEELVTAGGSKPLIHAAHVFAVQLTRARFRLNVGVIVGGDSNILKRPDTNLIGSNYGVMYVDSIGICYTVLSNPTYTTCCCSGGGTSNTVGAPYAGIGGGKVGNLQALAALLSSGPFIPVMSYCFCFVTFADQHELGQLLRYFRWTY